LNIKQFKDHTDNELALLLERGRDDAFSEIYERYWERLFIYVYSRTSSSDVAFEITQDIFVSLWQRRGEVVFHTSLSGYLYTSVRYRIIRHINSCKLKENYFRDFLAFNQLSSDNSNEEKINLNQLNEAIEKSVRELPKKCQEIFRMSRYQNLSIKEISVKLNISHKTVENHLTIALKHLRKSLGEFMITPLLFHLFF